RQQPGSQADSIDQDKRRHLLAMRSFVKSDLSVRALAASACILPANCIATIFDLKPFCREVRIQKRIPMALRKILSLAAGAVGAVLGGIAGYYLYWWILGQGLNALVLPGAMVGLGAGLFSLRRSRLLGVACGLAALPHGLY